MSTRTTQFVRVPRRTHWLGALSAAALLLTSSANALEFPQTRAGEIAQAYFESFNSGDAAAMAKFAAEYRSEEDLAERSAEERGQRTLGLFGQVGALDAAAVTADSEDGITITVHAEKVGAWLSCAFQLDDQEPRRLDSVAIQPTVAPEAQVSGADIPWDTLVWRDLADLLEQVRSTQEIPALAAAVVEGGVVVDAAVVGVREAGSDRAAQLDDRFLIGSIGKSMTATMIARLVELGTLHWDDTVGEVLADLPMNDAYRDVTLEQLLHHAAGLPGYLSFEEAEEDRLNAVTGSATERRAAFLEGVLVSEPAGPIGTMAYSNAGYVLAAFLAERRTERSWEELMMEHVMGPMDLQNTGFGAPATQVRPEQPRGHAQEDGAYKATPLTRDYPFDAYLAPAGVIHASIGDLAQYASAHLEGMRGHNNTLEKATFQWLHTPPAADGATGYAAGWMVRESDFGLVHTHAGSEGTFFAVVSLYPEQGRAVVVAMNIGPEGMPLADNLTNLLMSHAAQTTQ